MQCAGAGRVAAANNGREAGAAGEPQAPPQPAGRAGRVLASCVSLCDLVTQLGSVHAPTYPDLSLGYPGSAGLALLLSLGDLPHQPSHWAYSVPESPSPRPSQVQELEDIDRVQIPTLPH